jgi:hypothetical protein
MRLLAHLLMKLFVLIVQSSVSYLFEMTITFIFGIGERVTIVLPIFFYHNSAESLPRLGLGRVVTPSGFINKFQTFTTMNLN